jgi:Tol biopolymer transport system component
VNASPGWSPDGTKIAFTSTRDGLFKVYVMNADGTDQTRISGTTNDGGPAWSPDGTRIAFQSARDGHNQIVSMNVDGSGESRLTNSGATDQEPDWGPFAEVTGDVGPDGQTVDATGSAFTPGDTLTVDIASTPQVLGTAEVGRIGHFSQSFTVPCSVGAGTHTITATGTNGQHASAQVALTGCATPAAATKRAHTSSASATPAAALTTAPRFTG